jgi:hypothetical protein
MRLQRDFDVLIEGRQHPHQLLYRNQAEIAPEQLRLVRLLHVDQFCSCRLGQLPFGNQSLELHHKGGLELMFFEFTVTLHLTKETLLRGACGTYRAPSTRTVQTARYAKTLERLRVMWTISELRFKSACPISMAPMRRKRTIDAHRNGDT